MRGSSGPPAVFIGYTDVLALTIAWHSGADLGPTNRAILSSTIGMLTILPALGCSTSSLVRHGDPTFVRAQRQLAKTSTEIDALAPPAVEKALFMQGEGFYRYRFNFPARSFKSSLAQAGAVLIEFPTLQALAGSLDLIELRLKAYDGAVHTWETLLDQHPNTTLRPLALYRLGWAYRNSGATGFPRKSGDEAFDLLLREEPTSNLAPLARAAQSVRWKSKDSATAWSAVPGLGQFYVGEKLNGTVRLTIGLASVALIAAPTFVAYQRRGNLSWSRDWPLLAAGIGGLVILSINYTSAYQDAMRGVVEFNERAEAEFEDRHPEAP